MPGWNLSEHSTTEDGTAQWRMKNYGTAHFRGLRGEASNAAVEALSSPESFLAVGIKMQQH